MKRILTATCIFFALFGFSDTASAANYFNWNLESDITSIGEVYSYNGNSIRSADTAHSGSWAMKSTINGGDDRELGADVPWIYMPFDIVGGPALYYRWWMKISPGFNWGSGGAKMQAGRVLGENGIYPDIYTGYVTANGFSISGCEVLGPNHPAKGGGCDPANAATIALVPFNMRVMDDGEWHEYIVRVKPNSTAVSYDAEFQVWVDAVSYGTQTGFRIHDSYPDPFTEARGGWMVAHRFETGDPSAASGSSPGGTIYLDDFSLDDAYNTLIGVSADTIISAATGTTATAVLYPPRSAHQFGKNLSFGSRGEDVKILQRHFIRARLLAMGNDTGYFGKLTERAIKELQYKEEIVCHGTATTTGWGNFGPKTRAVLNRILSPTLGKSPKTSENEGNGHASRNHTR